MTTKQDELKAEMDRRWSAVEAMAASQERTNDFYRRYNLAIERYTKSIEAWANSKKELTS